MAANAFSISTLQGGVALPADSTYHTILQVKAPANQNVKITGVYVGFAGTSVNDNPIEWFTAHQSTAGTPLGVATPVHLDASPTAIQSTGAYGPFSAEPTNNGNMFDGSVQPELNGGFMRPLTREYIVLANTWFAIAARNIGTNANHVYATIECEE